MKKTFFASQLLQWYATHKRNLPWRNQKNPYFIWLSEVLLQQTRVQQGLPYYEKFVENFPTVQSLANAEENEVLRLWQGLGYYSRARNLHAAAKHIVDQLNGQFPNNYSDLIKLKGVGTYTAAAIASFAYNENVAVVDGNVYRVLSRVFGIHTDIASPSGAKEFSSLAHDLLPLSNTADYNQAIMEFGALHCTPALPKCNSCPLENVCIAKKMGIQHLLPVKINKIKKKIRYFNYLVFKFQDYLLLKARPNGDIWTGLYEFHLIEKDTLVASPDLLEESNINISWAVIESVSKDYKHLLTHQTLLARFTLLELSSKMAMLDCMKSFKLNSFTIEEIKELPKPVLIIKFLEDYAFL